MTQVFVRMLPIKLDIIIHILIGVLKDLIINTGETGLRTIMDTIKEL